MYQSLPPLKLKTCTSKSYNKKLPSFAELSCLPTFGRSPKSCLTTNLKQFKHVEDFHDLYKVQNVEVDYINNLIDNCNLRSRAVFLKEQLNLNKIDQMRRLKSIEPLTEKHESLLNIIENAHSQTLQFVRKEQLKTKIKL
ncbi:Hypothetical_protein [Hexamita inflata]|uniref:Hypothetical_protein n=1 Tax=Hexamita inflata TaxID=28002 RepID=A0AA86TJA6_9EUKA|nr:Hypothetical protein HINF_LOCUS6616 [Hexamita inflata]